LGDEEAGAMVFFQPPTPLQPIHSAHEPPGSNRVKPNEKLTRDRTHSGGAKTVSFEQVAGTT
jgi:hypothetical protein